VVLAAVTFVRALLNVAAVSSLVDWLTSFLKPSARSVVNAAIFAVPWWGYLTAAVCIFLAWALLPGNAKFMATMARRRRNRRTSAPPTPPPPDGRMPIGLRMVGGLNNTVSNSQFSGTSMVAENETNLRADKNIFLDNPPPPQEEPPQGEQP
jgi:hypothetical protein